MTDKKRYELVKKLGEADKKWDEAFKALCEYDRKKRAENNKKGSDV